MAAYLFKLTGGLGATPASGAPSGDAVVAVTLDEALVLKRQHVDVVTLDVDSVVDLNFGGIVNANVVMLRAIGGYVVARITFDDETTQAVPVDPLYLNLAVTKPITAIDLLRTSGVLTTVKIFLGEKA